jgi:hypothetical protein
MSFLLPVIPAGSTGTLQFVLTLPPSVVHGSTFLISLIPGNPYFGPSLDPGVVSQFVAGAQSYSTNNFGITIPASLASNLSAYVTSQLQTAIVDGRNDLVASLGAQSDVYSLSELLIDLATYGANLTTSGSPGEDPQTDPPSPCTGAVMGQGTSCGSTGNPVPSPDPAPSVNFSNFPTANKINPSDCKALPNHHVSTDGNFCVPNTNDGCPAIPTLGNPVLGGDYRCLYAPINNSVDPNDKAGTIGVGASHFVTNLQPLNYNITFENQSSATAPAQQVTITDQLDTANLDLTTFSLGPISFGSYTIIPPSGQSQYLGGLDLRPAQNVQVRLQAGLNKSTGLVTWLFQSIDPTSGQFTTDPLAGFLPPDVTPPQGIGTLVYSVAPKGSVTTNTVTCNQATVVFDFNAPLSTPTWCNSFDNTPPVSRVTALPATETSTSFTVQWSGTDVGSGIATYTIYVSDNGGAFTPFQTNTTATSATYLGIAGHTYGFYSIATDLVGNVEGPKTAAEATTTVVLAANCAPDVSNAVSIVRSGFSYSVISKRYAQTLTLTNTSGSALTGPIYVVLDSLSSNASLYNSGGSTACAAPLGSPYVSVAGTLSTGASATVVLQFTDPGNSAISYTTRVLLGAGQP